ncbi:hypothetical protein GGX14DRAFT_438792 [Mycena pura]|uniref:BAG domain-containing protein n=1 Tax=Mycena pura TaxID=153505 RepID=A0AAD6VRJ4_9AGAR|nr:hypothetical protein GGX14DRAFT_438792 [Mycena pura]
MARIIGPVAVAPPIPHHHTHQVLDKSAANWLVWERSITSTLRLVGLDGYLSGTTPCPNPAIDPESAANWHTNDCAVVAFLASKVSPSEQAYISGYAGPGGARTVWDALVARHADAPAAQIRLILEAFRVRYGTGAGATPPEQTTARIDDLATRILALGPITKPTLVSAIMVHAVQGADLDCAQSAPQKPPRSRARWDPAEQAAIYAIAAERSALERDFSPAVSEFLQSPAHDEGQWTRLVEALFQALNRVDTIFIAPEWEEATTAKKYTVAQIQKLQGDLENAASSISEAEKNAVADIESEMANIWDDLAPAVAGFLQQERDEAERSHLIELLVQSLSRLDKTDMEPEWEGWKLRKRAMDEVTRLFNMLESLQPTAVPSLSRAEQDAIAVIESELLSIQNVLAPAVATFLRPSVVSNTEKERRDLRRLLFETIQRLDNITTQSGWEQARQRRRAAVHAVESLQAELDRLPSCTEEQDAIAKIAAEKSKIQNVYVPAVTAFMANATERERMRLTEVLFGALERLDAVELESKWDMARMARKEAVREVQRLQDDISPRAAVSAEEQRALDLVESERLKVQDLLPPTKPTRKERAHLSELLLQALERLDGIEMQPGWQTCRQSRRNAVAEVQVLQETLDEY